LSHLYPHLDPVDKTELKKEIAVLKAKCDSYEIGKTGLEKEIAVLKAKCDLHEGILEALRGQVLRISDHLKILDSSYQGEQYEYSLQ
jgi:hypothetical protein